MRVLIGAVCWVASRAGLTAERMAHKWVASKAVMKVAQSVLQLADSSVAYWEQLTAGPTDDSLAVATVFPLVCSSAARKALEAVADLARNWAGR